MIAQRVLTRRIVALVLIVLRHAERIGERSDLLLRRQGVVGVAQRVPNLNLLAVVGGTEGHGVGVFPIARAVGSLAPRQRVVIPVGIFQRIVRHGVDGDVPAVQILRADEEVVGHLLVGELAEDIHLGGQPDEEILAAGELRSAGIAKDTTLGCELVTPKRENATRPAPYRK